MQSAEISPIMVICVLCTAAAAATPEADYGPSMITTCARRQASRHSKTDKQVRLLQHAHFVTRPSLFASTNPNCSRSKSARCVGAAACAAPMGANARLTAKAAVVAELAICCSNCSLGACCTADMRVRACVAGFVLEKGACWHRAFTMRQRCPLVCRAMLRTEYGCSVRGEPVSLEAEVVRVLTL